MLGELEVKRSARYGGQPQNTIEWVDIDWKSSENHTEDYLTLNRFILDDTLPSGDKADFQPFKRQSFPPIPIKKLDMMRNSKMKQELLTLLIEFTVKCRNMQYLMDGNHRTSILLLLTLLYTFEISSYKLDPIRLYVLYSNCCQDDWSERKQDILNYCDKKTRLGLVSHDNEKRQEIAGRVKYLWHWNSWFEVMSKLEQDWLRNRLRLHESKRNNLAAYRNWEIVHKERE